MSVPEPEPWTVEDTQKLQRWWQQAASRRDAHFKASSLNNTIGKSLEFPCIIIGSITSTVALTPREDGLVAYMSIATTILTACNSFMRFGPKASEHSAVSKSYGALARSIESAVLRRASPTQNFTDYVVALSESFDEISKTRPNLPYFIRATLDEQSAQLPTVFEELRSKGGSANPEDDIDIAVVT